jgi:proto-oncogene tyrosine-protein kinase Met
VVEQVGEGQFGIVTRATVVLHHGESVVAAVKFLKDDLEEADRRALIAEATQMATTSNAYVVKLLAVCLSSRPNFIVLEYMSHGDLKSYLVACGQQLSREHLLRLSLDASSGIAYLNSLKLVHRDVAARNVLLDERYHGKVGDFGLCVFCDWWLV